MSGGEVAGLALGAIALASLFQTCIDTFDYIQLAKNCIEDYKLRSLKIDLLNERLQSWGRELNILKAGHESPTLRDDWPWKSDAVVKSLLQLKSLLSESEYLIQKTKARKGSKHSLHLRQRTLWAIHDRNKLERLTQDISFLIDNLEIITSRSATYKYIDDKSASSIVTMSQTTTQAPKQNDTDGESKNPAKDGNNDLDDKTSSSGKESEDNPNCRGPRSLDTVRKNRQDISASGTFVIGVLDPTGSSLVEENEQKINQNGSGFSFMGTASTHAIQRIQNSKHESSKNERETQGDGNFSGSGRRINDR